MTDTGSVGQRLRQYIQFKNIKQNALSQLIGVTPGFTSKVLNGEEDITAKIIFGLVNSFPELNITWLLTGAGSMVLEQKPAEIQPNSVEGIKEPLDTHKTLLEHDQRIKALEEQLNLLHMKARKAD